MRSYVKGRAEAETPVDYEFVKVLPHSGGDYIEKVGDHYNLVHFSSDGMPFPMQINPEEYDFYGLKPLDDAGALDSSLVELGLGDSHSSEVFNSMMNIKPSGLEDLLNMADAGGVLKDINGIPVFDTNGMTIPNFSGEGLDIIENIPTPHIDIDPEDAISAVGKVLDVIIG